MYDWSRGSDYNLFLILEMMLSGVNPYSFAIRSPGAEAPNVHRLL
jgi:hypothetical protein